MTTTVLVAIVATIPPLCALVQMWRESRKYKAKYRQALRDLLAFHALEETYCGYMGPYERTKREVRKTHRDKYDLETPSGQATPQHIRNELAKL